MVTEDINTFRWILAAAGIFLMFLLYWFGRSGYREQRRRYEERARSAAPGVAMAAADTDPEETINLDLSEAEIRELDAQMAVSPGADKIFAEVDAFYEKIVDEKPVDTEIHAISKAAGGSQAVTGTEGADRSDSRRPGADRSPQSVDEPASKAAQPNAADRNKEIPSWLQTHRKLRTRLDAMQEAKRNTVALFKPPTDPQPARAQSGDEIPPRIKEELARVTEKFRNTEGVRENFAKKLSASLSKSETAADERRSAGKPRGEKAAAAGSDKARVDKSQADKSRADRRQPDGPKPRHDEDRQQPVLENRPENESVDQVIEAFHGKPDPAVHDGAERHDSDGRAPLSDTAVDALIVQNNPVMVGSTAGQAGTGSPGLAAHGSGAKTVIAVDSVMLDQAQQPGTAAAGMTAKPASPPQGRTQTGTAFDVAFYLIAREGRVFNVSDVLKAATEAGLHLRGNRTFFFDQDTGFNKEPVFTIRALDENTSFVANNGAEQTVKVLVFQMETSANSLGKLHMLDTMLRVAKQIAHQLDAEMYDVGYCRITDLMISHLRKQVQDSDLKQCH